MGQLGDYLRAWRAEIAPHGFSQPFETMDLTIVDRLEARLPGCPVAAALVNSLSHTADALRRIDDFDRWLPVYEEYAEAKVGLQLLEMNLAVERIVPPRGQKRPDFSVRIGSTDFFVEVKTLHARQGAGGYRRSMEDSFESLVNLEQRRGTRRVISAETVIQPHRSPGDTNYDPWSNRQIIETLIGRAVEHIKPGQFDQGPTVFALELSLLPLRSSMRDELLSAYPNPHEGVATSGILWNLAFAEESADIFRPVDFRGASNLDGQLQAAGLMQGNRRPHVRGMWILYGNDTGWLVRSGDEQLMAPLTGVLPARLNNELNELLCRQQCTVPELTELHSMVAIKAYEMCDARRSTGKATSALDDWLSAKLALKIPTCAPV